MTRRHGRSPCLLSRCVILATRSVATGRFGKVIRASHQLLSSVAGVSLRITFAGNLLQLDSEVCAVLGAGATASSVPGCRNPPSPAAPQRQSR
jgi:hypothetical protein